MPTISEAMFLEHKNDLSKQLEVLQKASRSDAKVLGYVKTFLSELRDGEVPTSFRYPLDEAVQHSCEKIQHLFSIHVEEPTRREQLVDKLSSVLRSLQLPPPPTGSIPLRRTERFIIRRG